MSGTSPKLALDTLSREADEGLLDFSEAVIAAHKAAVRAGDTVAIALLEPLLRHAGACLMATFAPLVRDDPGDRRGAALRPRQSLN